MKVCVYTLGCKVNQYDSDAIINGLKHKGYEVTDKLEMADVYIVNTCAVTHEAERKSRQIVSRANGLNKNAKIYVIGCASQNDNMQFLKDGVVYVGGTANKMALVNFEKLEKSYSSCENTSLLFEETGIASSLRTRHYLKVQDGCNNFCNYCLVPYMRGPSRSREISHILCEMDEAVKKVKEIVLTGINLSAYGLDNGSSLTDLIKKLKDYNVRIRLGSLEVGVIDREFLEALTGLKKFCDHFHLSLQSGDDETLKAMGRKYSTDDYYRAVTLIREYFKDCAITTDIIVGYPTETEEQFINSLNFVKKVQFADIHVFSYSPREKTKAYDLKPLNGDIILSRQKRMSEVKNQLKKEYNSKFIGKPLEVLFECKSNGFMSGHTPNYITVYSDKGVQGQLITIIPQGNYIDGLK